MAAPLVCVLGGALALLTGCAAPPSTPPALEPPPDGVILLDPRISESSGLARSAFDPDRLWTHNDSFHEPLLFAVSRRTGETLAALTVASTFNIDWEDLAAFDDHGQPALLLADVGDNWAIRPSVSLFVLHEPRFLDGLERIAPVRTLRLRYPDGPRDVEAVAVDGEERMVYLLSKRDPIPRLYRVSLDPPLPATLQVAEALGEIRIPRAEPGERRPQRVNWVTAMDFCAMNRRAAVVTLTQVHLYDRAEGEGWAEAFQRTPITLALPRLPQIEAAALTADGLALDLSSEGHPAPLRRIPLPLPHRLGP